MGWYEFASDLVRNKTVLDAGSGIGEGLELLNRTAATAVGQDIDPRLASERVRIEALGDIGDKEFDAVISIDVVEHVEEDHAFVRDLCRIAREFVFVTTPLWRLKRKFWPFHVREYSFQEFHDLAYPFGGRQFFKGDPSGHEIFQVEGIERFLTVERIINNEITNIPMRAILKLLPKKYRFAAHQAVIIRDFK